MRRYRSSIYSIPLDINLGTPEQMYIYIDIYFIYINNTFYFDILHCSWTHYATPFQTEGIAIHSLNLIIIPFGAIDYGGMFMSNDENSFNYLTWATIGNLIARQISHHFDANGSIVT